MSDPEHLARLKEGVEAWNLWRKLNPVDHPDLRDADLGGANVSGANLYNADLTGANLGKADLREAILGWANLREANLSGANLSGARSTNADLIRVDLSRAKLIKADLSFACLISANLSKADLSEAKLIKADLSQAVLFGANLSAVDLGLADLVETNLEDADLTDCHVYGVSVWNAKLDGAKQSNLIITPWSHPRIQVDNLEVAQFIYLLLNNKRIRYVIDTITSKVVLILGRFTPERKAVLDAIRDQLRHKGYSPVLFDFEKPACKDLTGTVTTLANMARFIIADLTDPSSVPHDLATFQAQSSPSRLFSSKDNESTRCFPILGGDTTGCWNLTNMSLRKR